MKTLISLSLGIPSKLGRLVRWSDELGHLLERYATEEFEDVEDLDYFLGQMNEVEDEVQELREHFCLSEGRAS